MGLPGSGKSTLSTKLAQKIGADHINSDKTREKFNPKFVKSIQF